MTGRAIAAFVEPILAAPDLRRVTLSGAGKGMAGGIRKAVLRPVEVQGRRRLQVVTYDARRSTTSNEDGPAAAKVQEVLAMPFRHVTVERAGEVLEARVTKKGELVTSRTAVEERPIELAHDRPKVQPVKEDAPFLELLGIASGGRVKPSRQAKYRQINDFVRLLDSAPLVAGLAPGDRVGAVDLGCGNAYLTFALHHHLAVTRGLECHVVGVDRNTELIERNAERAAAIGWDGLRFRAGDIESFTPEAAPDIVVALHACDTASDDALAAAVQWKSALAMVAPCCHHHVQAQLDRQSIAADDGLLLRHGILRERLGDVLTDVARATILRLLGYDVDVVEFVSPEHTPKNILIRASNRSLPVPPDLVAAYTDLVRRWSIEPRLGHLLASELAARGVT